MSGMAWGRKPAQRGEIENLGETSCLLVGVIGRTAEKELVPMP